MKHILTGVLFFAMTAAAFAQAPQPKPPMAVKVQVVIARYEGDKRVSSLPYTLSVTANSNERASIRMGSQVPVPSTNSTVTPPVTTYQYMNVGTSIDARATQMDDGRFSVAVSIEESSVSERRATDALPTLRSFNTQNTVLLKDGQTAQFTAAADKSTGEVVKVDVTLTVEK